jgi:hypothetical protein
MFRIKVYLAAASAFLAALLGVYLRGRRDEAAADAEKELNEYVEARRRMDAVDLDDPDSARQFLRDRQQSRGDL